MANANTNLMSFNPIRPTNSTTSTNRTQPAKSSRENYGLKNSKSNTPANSSHDKKSNFGAELDKANAQVNQSQNEDVQAATVAAEGEPVNEFVKASIHGKNKNKQDAPQDQIKNLPADENSKLVTENLTENLVNEVIDNQISPQVQTEIPVDAPQNIPQNVDVELEPKNISQPLTPTLTVEIPVDISKASVTTTEKLSPTIPADLTEENLDADITENPVDVENVPAQNFSADMAFYFTSTTENLLTTQNSNDDVDKSNLMSIMPQARDDKAQSMLDILSGKTWKSPKQTSETPEVIQAELPQDIPAQTQPTLTSAYTVQSQFATRKLDFRPLKVQAQLQNPLTQAQPTLQVQSQIQIPLTEGQPTLQTPQIQIPLTEGQPTLQTPQVEIPLTQAQPLQTQSQIQIPLTEGQPTLQTPQIEIPLTQAQPLQVQSQVQIPLTNQPTLQPQIEVPLTQAQPLQVQSQVEIPLTQAQPLQTQIEIPLTQTQPLQTQSQVQNPLINQPTLQTPQVEIPLTQAQPLQTQSQVQIPLTNQQPLQTQAQVEVPFTQVQAPADVPVAQGQSTIQPQFELPLTQNQPTLQAQPQVQQRQFGAEIQPQVNVLQAQFVDSKTVNRQEVSQLLGVPLQVENQPSTPIMPLQSTSNQFEQNPQQQQSMQNFRQAAQFTAPDVEVEGQVAEQLPKGAENFTANLTAVNNTPQAQPTAQVQSPEMMQAPREDFNVPAQIVEQARMIRTASNTEMVINLKPEHLGELTLRVSVSTNGAVTASFYSDNAQVRAIIENTIVQLKQELNDQGLKVDNVEVYAGLNEDSLLNGQGQQAWQQNQQQHNRRGQINLNVVEEEIDALNPVTENISAEGVDYKV